MSDPPANNRPDESSDSRKPTADSTGSYDAPVGSSPAASQEDQPTVISRTPVLKSAAKQGRGLESASKFNGPDAYQPGSRLGHFEIHDFIGGGGMGRVYRALDVTLARSVAVKILSHESSSDKETARRFLNEARAAARLNHENIAQVYYVGEDDGLPFIAFEYVEGMNIRAMVDQRGPLPLGEAISFTLQVAHALAHAAERQVIHRDIKPSNILITPEGQAKVIDMGLARLENPDDSGSDLTASGVTLGTFDYISPEQARDPRNADTRSDTYSLGCTLFYMLAGRPPFPEGTVLQKLLQHQGDEPPDIRHFRPELPEEVSRVLRKMMAKDPRRRYQDSGRLIEALLTLADLAGILPQGPSRAIWVAPKQPTISLLQRHAPWLIPIAALVCMIVLLDIFWSRSNSPDYPGPRRLARNTIPAGNGLSDTGQPASSANGVNETATAGPAAEMLDATSGNGNQSPPAALAQDDSGSGPSEPAKPSTKIDQPGAEGTDGEAEVFGPNPVHLLLAKHSSGAALRQDGLAAAALAAGRLSIGLSPAPRAPSVAAEISAAEGMNGDSTIAPSAESPTAAMADLLIVAPGSKNDKAFSSLRDAVKAARPDDVIELRFDGRSEEKPLTLTNRKVTVRAGDGFRPVLVFRPLEVDPLKYPREMFNVAGGELTLANVALELDVPRGVPADSWSLFKIGAGEKVTLQACSLTIRNASDQQTAHHPEVAFFRFVSSARMAMADPGAENGMAPRALIDLQNCLARGEAVFLRAEAPQPIDVVWHNGLLATTERFLVADGYERLPTPDEIIHISLEHVTAAVRSGLCRFVQTEFTPRQLDTYFNCSASIFIAHDAPLIEQAGLLDVERSRGEIKWHGERDFYQGITFFRVLRPLDPTIEPEELPLYGQERISWKSFPKEGRSVHAIRPSDYALGGTPATNPARFVTDEDAGAIIESLPKLPPEPVIDRREGRETAPQ